MDSSAINKLELAKWVIDLEDENLLYKITQMMNDSKKIFSTSEKKSKQVFKAETTLGAEEVRAGISGEELKKRMFDYIDTLPWKK